MKREFLKELGLEDEAIDKIMAENGKDIEKYKTAAETHKTENEGLKAQLGDANKQIEAFKGMDIESIKKAADDYKIKAEEAEKDAQAKLDAMQFNHALENALRDNKVKNSKAVKALLDKESIKLDGEKLLGLDEQIAKLKESDSYLFEEEAPAGNGSKGNFGRQQQTGKNPWSKEHFNLSEQGRLFKENPELAKQMMADAKK